MIWKNQKLFYPLAILLVFLLARYAFTASMAKWNLPNSSYWMPPIDHSLSICIVLSTTWLLTRLMDVTVWKGVFERRQGEAPVDLLINMGDLVLWAVGIGVINHFVFGNPVGGLLTASGVFVALVAFALKSLIADTFSGIALALERPFRIGDWLEAGNGVGMVIKLSWRATSLQQQNGVIISIPNSRMAEMPLLVYRVWRDQIELEIDFAAKSEMVEKVLLDAAAVARPFANMKPPVARSYDFGANGVKWRLIYSLPDYASKLDIRDQIIRAANEGLRAAGISTAISTQRVRLQMQEREYR